MSFSLSAELADTLVWEIFGITADTLSNLTFVYLLSITSQIDWHAWLTFRSLVNALGFQYVDFLCQQAHYHSYSYLYELHRYKKKTNYLKTILDMYTTYWHVYDLHKFFNIVSKFVNQNKKEKIEREGKSEKLLS